MRSHSDKHLRVHSSNPFHLDDIDPTSTSGLSLKGKEDAKKQLRSKHLQLADLQARLWAEHSRSLLVVLQALDAGGKDGTIRRVFKGVNPQGVVVTGFRQPTALEASHDFLWRIHQAVPAKGQIAIYNRSHYEDVVAAFVVGLIDDKKRQLRFEEIRAFEDYLDRNGIELIKVFLHISKEEQKRRLQDRVDNPKKQWKFSKTDLDTRDKWNEYQDAYSEAIGATNTDASPWFVIPSNHRWARDFSVMQLLIDRLELMNPHYPRVADLGKVIIK